MGVRNKTKSESDSLTLKRFSRVDSKLAALAMKIKRSSSDSEWFTVENAVSKMDRVVFNKFCSILEYNYDKGMKKQEFMTFLVELEYGNDNYCFINKGVVPFDLASEYLRKNGIPRQQVIADTIDMVPKSLNEDGESIYDIRNPITFFGRFLADNAKVFFATMGILMEKKSYETFFTTKDTYSDYLQSMHLQTAAAE